MKASMARVCIIIAMILFGTLPLFVRNINLPSAEIALYRAILAIVLIGPILLVSRAMVLFSKIRKSIPILLLSGVAMGFNWILLFEAYRYTTVSIATLAYYIAPLIVALLSPFLFREKPTAKQMVCFLFSTIGLVLVIGIAPNGIGSNHLFGNMYGLGAAVLYATVIILNKFIKDVDGLLRTFLQFVAAVIVLLPYVAITSGFSLGTLSSQGWISLLIVGILHSGIAYCLYFRSMKSLPGQETALLSYIDPVVAVLVSVLLLHEPLTILQAIGGILILGFTVLNELPTTRKRKS